MKFHNRVILAGSVVGACLVMGTAGVVAAAGVQGKGPASVLSNLVADGTLTQEQADKVADAFKAQREEMHKEMESRRAEVDALIATTLGISEEELKKAREEGKSLKEIAGDKRDALIDALAAHMDAQTDKALADGRITQEQADKAKARSKEMATQRVDSDRGFHMKFRGPGPRGDGERPDGPPPGGPGDFQGAPEPGTPAEESSFTFETSPSTATLAG